jgi:hypothetical protein
MRGGIRLFSSFALTTDRVAERNLDLGATIKMV